MQLKVWQSSNTSKWENFTVGNDPRRNESNRINSNSNFNYTLSTLELYLLTKTISTKQFIWFGSVPDNTLIQTHPNASQHNLYDGFDMYKNLNVNGGTPYPMVYSVMVIDPQVGLLKVK